MGEIIVRAPHLADVGDILTVYATNCGVPQDLHAMPEEMTSYPETHWVKNGNNTFLKTMCGDESDGWLFETEADAIVLTVFVFKEGNACWKGATVFWQKEKKEPN